MSQEEPGVVEQVNTIRIHIGLDFSVKVPAILTPVYTKIEDQGQLQRLYEALLADRQALKQYVSLMVIQHCEDFTRPWWHEMLLDTATSDETILEPVFNRLSKDDLIYFSEQIAEQGLVEAIEPLIETLQTSLERVSLTHNINELFAAG